MLASFGLKNQNVCFTSSSDYTKKKKINESFNPVTSAKYLIGWQEFFIIRTDENQRKLFKTDFLADQDI